MKATTFIRGWPLHYQLDGSGRDSYIYHNHGGLLSEAKAEEPFKLRQYRKLAPVNKSRSPSQTSSKGSDGKHLKARSRVDPISGAPIRRSPSLKRDFLLLSQVKPNPLTKQVMADQIKLTEKLSKPRSIERSSTVLGMTGASTLEPLDQRAFSKMPTLPTQSPKLASLSRRVAPSPIKRKQAPHILTVDNSMDFDFATPQNSRLQALPPGEARAGSQLKLPSIGSPFAQNQRSLHFGSGLKSTLKYVTREKEALKKKLLESKKRSRLSALHALHDEPPNQIADQVTGPVPAAAPPRRSPTLESYNVFEPENSSLEGTRTKTNLDSYLPSLSKFSDELFPGQQFYEQRYKAMIDFRSGRDKEALNAKSIQHIQNRVTSLY